jgi:hypothetical protein
VADTTETRERPGLHDTVQLVTRMFFDDDLPREGKVVSVDDDTVTVEFPDPQGRADYPPMTFHMTERDWRHLTIVRKADVDELDKARAEVATLRERLSEIGTYASEQARNRSGWSVAGASFEKIARLARQS